MLRWLAVTPNGAWTTHRSGILFDDPELSLIIARGYLVWALVVKRVYPCSRAGV